VQEPSTRLIDIFDRLDHALLILGAPGAGKTTLLLTLARELLMRAAQDPEQPIPVVFPLSSWAQRRCPLADWLVDALREQYDVPRKLGQAWITADAILPLLDGLDEVALEYRAGCVEAINTFRNDHGLLPLVACSRMADYEALGMRLRLPGAVVLLPLMPAQVDSYLSQVGQPVAAVRDALQEDPTLWELLDTPLMLTIMTLAYRGEPMRALPIHAPPEVQRHHVFAVYVDRMFQRRSTITQYTRQQTERWLMWLARAMQDHSQTMFYLEWMQPDWVTEQRQLKILQYTMSVMIMMLYGPPLLWIGMLLAQDLGIPLAVVYGMFGMLFAGTPIVLLLRKYTPVGRLASRLEDRVKSFPLLFYQKVSSTEIKPIEKIQLSWSAVPFKRLILFGPLAAGLFVGLFAVVLSDELPDRLFVGLFAGGIAWLVTGMWGLRIWLHTGVTIGEIALHSFPNEGIKCSMQNGLIIGLVSALEGGLPSGLMFGLMVNPALGLDFGLLSGLISGLSVGLVAGGYACLHHFALRLVLWHNNFAPLNYIAFLDYAAARIFLRKVGGGYIFVHRMLLEYFAAKYQTSVKQQNCNTHG
jgi:DNA polymerase III delta prime subunit